MDFKARCIECTDKSVFTVGHTYEVSDGAFHNERGTLINFWSHQGNGQGIGALNYWYGRGSNIFTAEFQLVEEPKMFTKDDIQANDKVVTRHAGKGTALDFNGELCVQYQTKGYDTVRILSSNDFEKVIRPQDISDLSLKKFESGITILDREKGIGCEPEHKLQVGDSVKIRDNGKLFTTYESFLPRVAAQFTHNYICGAHPIGSEVFKVVAIGKHENSGYDTVFAVQDKVTLQVFLISEDGLVKV